MLKHEIGKRGQLEILASLALPNSLEAGVAIPIVHIYISCVLDVHLMDYLKRHIENCRPHEYHG